MKEMACKRGCLRWFGFFIYLFYFNLFWAFLVVRCWENEFGVFGVREISLRMNEVLAGLRSCNVKRMCKG